MLRPMFPFVTFCEVIANNFLSASSSPWPGSVKFWSLNEYYNGKHCIRMQLLSAPGFHQDVGWTWIQGAKEMPKDEEAKEPSSEAIWKTYFGVSRNKCPEHIWTHTWISFERFKSHFTTEFTWYKITYSKHVHFLLYLFLRSEKWGRKSFFQGVSRLFEYLASNQAISKEGLMGVIRVYQAAFSTSVFRSVGSVPAVWSSVYWFLLSIDFIWNRWICDINT